MASMITCGLCVFFTMLIFWKIGKLGTLIHTFEGISFFVVLIIWHNSYPKATTNEKSQTLGRAFVGLRKEMLLRCDARYSLVVG